MGHYLIETERLGIRPMGAEDAPFILELLNEPAFIRNIADKGVRTLEDARGYIEGGPRASYARHGFGLWVVELKASGEALGMCGLIKRDGLEDVDIGFAFLERYGSKGYATESASAVLAYGFHQLGLRRIVAITASFNTASARLLERIGLRDEGMIVLPQYGGENRLFALDAPLGKG